MDTLFRVAFVCPRITGPFSRSIWYSLQEAARGLGVQLTAVTGGPLDHPRSELPARRVYDLLDPRNFDGIILQTTALGYFSDEDALGRFVDGLAPLPVVSLGLSLKGVTSVAIDQATAVRELVTHLHRTHGYRRFAFVCGSEQQMEAQERKKAFLQVLEELGVPGEHIDVFPGEFDRASGAHAVRSLATRNLEPLALVCSNDEEAIGALEQAKVLGIRVPVQMAIVGFDDVDLAPLQEPSLTTVGQPLIRQAHRALRLLLRKLQGDRSEVHEVEGARVYYRESCGCPSAASGRGTDKASLLIELMATQENATENYQTFLRTWVSDFLTAFEYLLETGNASVLKSQWTQYYESVHLGQERGLPLRVLFSGLEALYGSRGQYQKAMEENLLLAGAAKSGKSARDDQSLREFFFALHEVEEKISHVNDRARLMALPFSRLVRLGIQGLVLVRFGVPPRVLYCQTRVDSTREDDWGPLDYPRLLPQKLELAAPLVSRLVISLVADQTYLGYAVFWTESSESFPCDFLATQIAGTIHRIELLERIQDQQRSLETSLEESRKMQQQLVETEKVASLGRLVAGVAHEINTPLGTGITGTSFLLDRTGEVQALFDAGTLSRSGLVAFLQQGREALEGVLRNLMKAGELIQAFKGLGLDHGQGEWKPIQLKTLFGDLGSVYSAEFSKRGIQFQIEIPSEATMVYSQPSALVQVTGELLENAMDHAFPPGFVRVPQILLQVEVLGDVLRLAVTDNGRGLAAEERRHIFDPLYTTRRPEGHAGLGLHLAFQLVSRTLGGQMTVASEPGAGSCFLCLVPLVRS